jgi:hypothetical protein
MDLCYFYFVPKVYSIPRISRSILIISLFTTGISTGQVAPMLTVGPENGHLIIAGDLQRGIPPI